MKCNRLGDSKLAMFAWAILPWTVVFAAGPIAFLHSFRLADRVIIAGVVLFVVFRVAVVAVFAERRAGSWCRWTLGFLAEFLIIGLLAFVVLAICGAMCVAHQT
jgi:hypothetical protein